MSIDLSGIFRINSRQSPCNTLLIIIPTSYSNYLFLLARPLLSSRAKGLGCLGCVRLYPAFLALYSAIRCLNASICSGVLVTCRVFGFLKPFFSHSGQYFQVGG